MFIHRILHLRLARGRGDAGRGSEAEVAHEEGGLGEGALPAHRAHQLPAGPVHRDGGLHLRVEEAVEEADHQALASSEIILQIVVSLRDKLILCPGPECQLITLI